MPQAKPCPRACCSASPLPGPSRVSPRLLILDEANTAFDYESDLALTNGLLSLKGQITIVLITSRPSFAAIADRVFTLVDGKFHQMDRANSSSGNAGTSAGNSA